MRQPAERAERTAGEVRSFVALDLAPAVRDRIRELTGDLRRSAPEVRWSSAEKLHVTLKFLGETPAERIEVVRGALAAVAATTAPFAITASGLGVFPDPRRARVVWIGLLAAEVEPLARAIDTVLAGVGFPPEARPFAAHVTIGRVRRPGGWPGAARVLEAHGGTRFGVTRAEEIVLYRSDFDPAGARYAALDRIPLG